MKMNLFEKFLYRFGFVRYKRYVTLYKLTVELNNTYKQYRIDIEQWQKNITDQIEQYDQKTRPPNNNQPKLTIIQGDKK